MCKQKYLHVKESSGKYDWKFTCITVKVCVKIHIENSMYEHMNDCVGNECQYVFACELLTSFYTSKIVSLPIPAFYFSVSLSANYTNANKHPRFSFLSSYLWLPSLLIYQLDFYLSFSFIFFLFSWSKSF